MCRKCSSFLSSNACAGILGENVPIPPVITQTVGQFWIVNIATLAVCMVVFTAL